MKIKSIAELTYVLFRNYELRISEIILRIEYICSNVLKMRCSRNKHKLWNAQRSVSLPKDFPMPIYFIFNETLFQQILELGAPQQKVFWFIFQNLFCVIDMIKPSIKSTEL